MLAAPDFRHTWLWRQAFVVPQAGIIPEDQEFFRDRLLSVRERVGLLVSRIAADMPDFTVHDLTHLDALWEMASIVSEGAIQLTPAEAYVFGGAVLLHDAAMTVAAYRGGLAEIK